MANNKMEELIPKGVPYGMAVGVATSTAVSAPAALTSTADQPGAYQEAEAQKIRDDIAALRTTVAAMHTALVNAGVLPT